MKKRHQLTEHVELEGARRSLALGVGGVTRVAAGGVPGNALQNQARLAHDDPGADVVRQHVALRMDDNTRNKTKKPH